MLINPIDLKIQNSTNFRAKPSEFKLSKGVVAKVLEFPKNTNNISEKLEFGDPFYVLRYYTAVNDGRNFTKVEKGIFESAERQNNGAILLNKGTEGEVNVRDSDNILTTNQYLAFVLKFKNALGELKKVLE
jgi:hypothetical protein